MHKIISFFLCFIFTFYTVQANAYLSSTAVDIVDTGESCTSIATIPHSPDPLKQSNPAPSYFCRNVGLAAVGISVLLITCAVVGASLTHHESPSIEVKAKNPPASLPSTAVPAPYPPSQDNIALEELFADA